MRLCAPGKQAQPDGKSFWGTAYDRAHALSGRRIPHLRLEFASFGIVEEVNCSIFVSRIVRMLHDFRKSLSKNCQGFSPHTERKYEMAVKSSARISIIAC